VRASYTFQEPAPKREWNGWHGVAFPPCAATQMRAAASSACDIFIIPVRAQKMIMRWKCPRP